MFLQAKATELKEVIWYKLKHHFNLYEVAEWFWTNYGFNLIELN